jgi:DNA transformation protein
MYNSRKRKFMTSCSVTRDYLMLDVFAHIPSVTSKPLFGGCGFYKDNIIFACIADGKLYFKVDAINRPQYEAMGSPPFIYEHKNTQKITAMPYYELPELILEDPKQLKMWIDEAVAASLRSKTKRKTS